MIQAVLFIDGFAGQAHAQPLEYPVVHGGEDDRGMYLAALELVQRLHGLQRVWVAGRADRQRDEHLVGVQARVSALHVIGFERLDGGDHVRAA